jgi:catechol 2,3-dioxygenase-like lactoylglutathione lyase family enzyme
MDQTTTWGVIPSLRVPDMEAAVTFYRDVLGFVLVDVLERSAEAQGLMTPRG